MSTRPSRGLIYVMDMESSLSDSLVRRVVDMDQYLIFRKWDMKIDPRAEVEAYKGELRGIIISGSGKNINSKKSPPPTIPAEMFSVPVPILAICYGMQYLAHLQGVPIVRCWDEKEAEKRTKELAKTDKGEQGPVVFYKTEPSKLFTGLGEKFPVWMRHNWMLEDAPPNWRITGRTDKCPVAAMECGDYYALQFHPEPSNSLFGRTILHNFFTYICGVTTPYF
jgi:GMP synthase (glutamine-hydrolysing)